MGWDKMRSCCYHPHVERKSESEIHLDIRTDSHSYTADTTVCLPTTSSDIITVSAWLACLNWHSYGKSVEVEINFKEVLRKVAYIIMFWCGRCFVFSRF